MVPLIQMSAHHDEQVMVAVVVADHIVDVEPFNIIRGLRLKFY
jgi:hypothetical protein